MSIALVQWAYGQDLPSSKKFVLVTICHRTKETYFGSLSGLARDTGLNIKTARAAVHWLVNQGYLVDTGRRRGQTGQIREYWVVSENFTETITERDRLAEFDGAKVTVQ